VAVQCSDCPLCAIRVTSRSSKRHLHSIASSARASMDGWIAETFSRPEHFSITRGP
jgi:hypothetical protein